MTSKKKLASKIISVVICIALLLGMIPMTVFDTVTAATGEQTLVSDPSTIEQWKDYFPIDGDISTENAGGVWSDKSVFTQGTSIDGRNFSIQGENNFLVALSSIGSNMSVTGQAAVPTDTVLVLDMSNSMDGNIGALASAANTSLKSLFEANPNNRVAIVTYNQSSSVFLPLDTYKPNSSGNFLTNNGNTLMTVSGVTDSSGNRVSESVGIRQRTYIQSGIKTAIDVLEDRTITTDRIPVVVLLSDGEATVANTDVVNLSTEALPFDYSTGAGAPYAFATQLSIAHMKQKRFEKLLFYSIGVDVSTNGNALAVLQGGNAGATQSQWTNWTRTQTGSDYTLIDNYRIRKTEELASLTADYSDGYFDASSSSGTSLSEALAEAFASVMAEIVKQSVYAPTLIQSAGHELSGYVSFIDKIGSYMKVSDIKGIMYGGQLYTGENIAKSFAAALAQDPNGALGPMSDPSSLGYAFMRSIESRLGIDNAKAWEVLRNAWQKGQIYYDSASNTYSNWFGWISSSSGAYIEPWYEGKTLPVNAAYINRSYIYLGASGDTNMMYSTIRIREKVENGVPTGEQEVNFAVPASLLPTITYEVSLDKNNNLEDINVISDTPIHLVYEVGLDPEINKFNMTDKVSAEYLRKNTDTATGKVNFYTNEWEREPDADGKLTGYYKKNTYAYFRPSQRNDRYYYQNDSLVYSDKNGTEYNSATAPKDADGESYYYYNYYSYDATAGKYEIVEEHHVIPKDVLGVAQNNGDNTWTIKAGTIRSDYSGSDAVTIYKDDKSTAGAYDGNKTGTLVFSHEPFADTNDYAWNDTTHSSVVGVTMANNGLLAMEPESGIRLSKTLAPEVNLAGENPSFMFILSYTGSAGTVDALAYRYDENGELVASKEKVSFTSGIAQVNLKAGEHVYIGGLDAGSISVSEVETYDYDVQTVMVNGKAQANANNISLIDGEIVNVDFVNGNRNTGNLIVSKEVVWPAGVDEAAIKDKQFEIKVLLEFNGQKLANRIFNADTPNAFTTNEDGYVVFKLKHDEYRQLLNIPEGVDATITETLDDSTKGFTAEYWEESVVGDGVITIAENHTASAMVVNTYTPNEVYPVNIEAYVSKELSGLSDWRDVDSYEFRLEQFDFATEKWDETNPLASKTITKDTNNKSINFNDVFNNSNFKFEKAGQYLYRVREVVGTVAGITYDTALHSFLVTVGDKNIDGQLEILSVEPGTGSNVVITEPTAGNGNKYVANAEFTNTFSANETSATIEIRKHVINDSKSPFGTLDGFTFDIFRVENGAETKVGTTDATSLAGIIRYEIPFADADRAGENEKTFNYVIREVQGNKAGWTYSTNEVYVSVKLTLDGGNLVAAAYVDNSTFTETVPGNATSLAVIGANNEFTNTYTPNIAKLDVNANKSLVGRAFTSNDRFTFEITGISKNNGEAYTLLDSNGNEISSNTISGTAATQSATTDPVKIAFGSLYFDEVGLYFHEITETSKSENGITADSNKYQLTVEVTDDGNGNLVAKPTYVGHDDSFTFVNTYTAEPAKLVIEGTKTLTGRDLFENDFQFILKQNGTNNEWHAVNSTSGSKKSAFAFPELTYTEAGEYKYKVSEYDPTKETAGYTDGVKYDDTVYDIVVTVEDNNKGKLEAAYTVNGSSTTEIAFANEYAPTPVNVSIEGTKVLFGRNITENDTFTFNLYDVNYDAADRSWTPGKKLDSTNSLVNGHITFDLGSISSAGRYRYMVTEEEGKAGGVTYDKTTWRVVVAVNDDGHGKLTPTIYYLNDNGLQDRMVFTNNYEISDGELVLSGTKTLENKTLTDGAFTFNLYETADDTFEVSGTPAKTVKNNAAGKFDFTLNYTKDDIGETKYYVVKEANAGKTIDGITYSNVEYRITVQIEDDGNGKVKATANIRNSGRVAQSLDFTNEYNAAAAKLTIPGLKELNGSRQLNAEEFTFDIYSADSSYVYGGAVVQSAKNAADGTFEFKDIELTEAKTYYFVIKENSQAALPGVTYDDSEYNVSVEVTDNGKGQLVAGLPEVVKKTAAGTETADMVKFTNSYLATDTVLNISGNKVLTGRTLAVGEFTFLLNTADSQYTIDTNVAALKAVNDAQGAFTFDALTYSQAGTYYYVVSEDSSQKAERVTYDERKYYVEVAVTDDGSGKLAAEYKAKEAPDAADYVNGIVFTNTFTPKPEDLKVNLFVDKDVLNRGSETITPEGFSFQLNNVGTGETYIAKSDKDGKAQFDLYFTEDNIGKTYDYKLTEVNDGRENVTYSQTIYDISITITLGSDNKLVANFKKNGAAVESVTAGFVNEYEVVKDDADTDKKQDKEKPDKKKQEKDKADKITVKSVRPKTGDISNIYLWLAVLLISGGGIIGATLFGKRKRVS